MARSRCKDIAATSDSLPYAIRHNRNRIDPNRFRLVWHCDTQDFNAGVSTNHKKRIANRDATGHSNYRKLGHYRIVQQTGEIDDRQICAGICLEHYERKVIDCGDINNRGEEYFHTFNNWIVSARPINEENIPLCRVARFECITKSVVRSHHMAVSIGNSTRPARGHKT